MDRPILHFTDVSNISSIVSAGGLRPDGVLSATPEAFTDCASPGIKEARRAKPVPVRPFGCVGDYVPFYYAPRSPTMSAISHGNVPHYQDARQLIYLASSLARVGRSNAAWACSDGNARTGITQFFNTWEDLEERIDWAIMKERYWSNTPEDGDRKRRRMAEFLIRDFVPLGLVFAVVAHSQQVLARIRPILPDGIETYVHPDYYI